MTKQPIYVYREGYLFCIKGYHVLAKAWGTMRFTNPPVPMFDDGDWKIEGRCDGSCRNMQIKVPEGIIKQIKKLKQHTQGQNKTTT